MFSWPIIRKNYDLNITVENLLTKLFFFQSFLKGDYGSSLNPAFTLKCTLLPSHQNCNQIATCLLRQFVIEILIKEIMSPV